VYRLCRSLAEILGLGSGFGLGGGLGFGGGFVLVGRALGLGLRGGCGGFKSASRAAANFAFPSGRLEHFVQTITSFVSKGL